MGQDFDGSHRKPWKVLMHKGYQTRYDNFVSFSKSMCRQDQRGILQPKRLLFCLWRTSRLGRKWNRRGKEPVITRGCDLINDPQYFKSVE